MAEREAKAGMGNGNMLLVRFASQLRLGRRLETAEWRISLQACILDAKPYAAGVASGANFPEESQQRPQRAFIQERSADIS
jgi:hypothetical protein